MADWHQKSVANIEKKTRWQPGIDTLSDHSVMMVRTVCVSLLNHYSQNYIS